VLYVWHPPLTVGVSAWAIAKLKGVRFVYDVQDLWPESALASGLMKPGRLTRAMYRLADWIYARADRLLVVSSAAADHLRERGVDPGKIRVAKHWIDESMFDTAPTGRNVRAEFGLEGRFVVAFAGNLGLVQGLETVIDAAELLQGSNVTVLLIGDGSDRARLEQDVARRGVTNVIFAGRHPASAMPDFFRAADALLVHLRDSSVAAHAIPTKILAYLAAAKPIVCAMPGAAADLVAEADAGPVVPPGDPQALATAITKLAAMTPASREALGVNGQRYLSQHFRKDRVITEYEDILREVAAPAEPGGSLDEHRAESVGVRERPQ
jgi:glycosyltransferase involved in cell wall biosynthesis